MRKRTITVQYVHPPIPIRDYDWVAYYGDYDLGVRVAYGKTPKAAIEALKGGDVEDGQVE